MMTDLILGLAILGYLAIANLIVTLIVRRNQISTPTDWQIEMQPPPFDERIVQLDEWIARRQRFIEAEQQP